jgi:hypothetical protein
MKAIAQHAQPFLNLFDIRGEPVAKKMGIAIAGPRGPGRAVRWLSERPKRDAQTVCRKRAGVSTSRRWMRNFYSATSWLPTSDFNVSGSHLAIPAQRTSAKSSLRVQQDRGRAACRSRFRSPPQPALEPIGEAGRGIHHDGAGIHFAQEAHRARVVFGDDRVCVLRAISIDYIEDPLEHAPNSCAPGAMRVSVIG